jgi:putative inorganic carbon (hco3(-)) transporter
MLKLPRQYRVQTGQLAQLVRALRSHRRGQRFESSVAHQKSNLVSKCQMNIVKFLLLSSLASLIPGQLVRFSFSQNPGAVTVTDILVFITGIIFLIYAPLFKKSIKVPPKIFLPAILFILAASSSTILAVDNFSKEEIIIASLFLVRFAFYFLITIVFYNVVKKREVIRWINSFLLTGFIFIVIGLTQFVIFPDISFLIDYGWDPHQARVVSTLLDPNFSGGIFTILIAFSIALYLYQKKSIYLALTAFSFFALILTFSRSSYLSAVAVVLTIGILKSPKVIIISLAVGLITFLLIPQARSRIIGAVTFDETARARLISWQNAITIFKYHPLFGVGFNTYRFAQSQYGFFASGDLGGHSGAGTDSSILLVAATTGIFGLSFYIFFLISIFAIFVKKARESFLHLASLASFMGLLVHSQFVNSLFFPQIMLLLFFILGLTLVKIEQK